MLELATLTFRNSETGNEVTVPLLKALKLELPKSLPNFPNDKAAATFLAEAVITGAEHYVKTTNFIDANVQDHVSVLDLNEI